MREINLIVLCLAVSGYLVSVSGGNECDCGGYSNLSKPALYDEKFYPWFLFLTYRDASRKIRDCRGIVASTTKIITYGCKTQRTIKIYPPGPKTIVSSKLPFRSTKPLQIVENPEWERLDFFYILNLKEPLKFSANLNRICFSRTYPYPEFNRKANNLEHMAFANHVITKSRMSTIYYPDFLYETETRKDRMNRFSVYEYGRKWFLDGAVEYRKIIPDFKTYHFDPVNTTLLEGHVEFCDLSTL